MPAAVTGPREPPVSEAELLARCAALAGKSLGQAAAELGAPVPESRARAKGWAGLLVEHYLGATAASRPEPDFQGLGIELKTIPINRRGRARESTFVCMAPTTVPTGLRWRDSAVRAKLSRVLWVPLESAPDIPLGNSRVGKPLLWSPTPAQERVLERDWTELTEMACLGQFEQLSPQHGEYLQIRPKAADAAELARATLPSGELGFTLPRGFYLRAGFTSALLRAHLALERAGAVAGEHA